jgi:hypothetical protein
VSGEELPDLNPDELLAALSGRAVRFLVVDGIGAQLYGAALVTKDLDVCVLWARENFERLAAALSDLDGRLDLPVELGELEVRLTAELLARTSMTRWHTRAGVIDVLHEIPAGEDGKPRGYAELEPNAVAVHGPNATVLVAALDDIIASKEHADREKDRQALPELYALRDEECLS